MGVLATNNAWGVLSIPITTDTTRILLSASQGDRFPRAISGSSWFYITIVSEKNEIEIVKCTNRSADTFDVERGADGTIPLRFDAGARVELRPVAALLNDKADHDELKTSLDKLRSDLIEADSTDFRELSNKIKEGDDAIKKDYATKEEVNKKFTDTGTADEKKYETIDGAAKKYVPIEGGTMTGDLNVKSEKGAGITVTGGDINIATYHDSSAGRTYGGNLNARGTVKAEVFRSTSDIRRKHGVVRLNGYEMMEKIVPLRPVAFEWNSNNEKDIGFIAQELQKEFPELVKKDTEGFLTINYQGLIPVAMSAIQLLFFKIAELEAQLGEKK